MSTSSSSDDSSSDTDRDIKFVGFGSSSMSAHRKQRSRLSTVRTQRRDRENQPTSFILTAVVDGPVGSINCASETYYKEEKKIIYVGRAHSTAVRQGDAARDTGNDRKKEDKESINAIFKSDVMSRQHCKFAFGDNGEICVTDLASHHGTFVAAKPPTTHNHSSHPNSQPTPPPSYSDIFKTVSRSDRSKDGNGDNNKSSNGGVFKKLSPYTKYALQEGDQIRFGKDVFKDNKWYYAITVSLKLLYPHSQTQSQHTNHASASRRLPSSDVSIMASSSHRSAAPPPSPVSASTSISTYLQARRPRIDLTRKPSNAKPVSTNVDVPNDPFTAGGLLAEMERATDILLSKTALHSSACQGVATTFHTSNRNDRISSMLDATSSAAPAEKDKDLISSDNAETNPNANERRFVHIPTSNVFAAPLTVGTPVNGNGNKKTSNRYGLISPSPPSSLSPSPEPEADINPDRDDSVVELFSREAENVRGQEDITSWDGRKSISSTSPLESVSILTSDVESQIENTESQNRVGVVDMDMEISDDENESENAMPGSISGVKSYDPNSSASNGLDSPASVKSGLSEDSLDSSDKNGSGEDDMLVSDAADDDDYLGSHIHDEAGNSAKEERTSVPFSRFSTFIPLHHSHSQPAASTTTASFIFGSSNNSVNVRPFLFQPLSTYFPSLPLPSSLPSLSTLNVPGLPKLNDIIPNVNNMLPSLSVSFPGLNLSTRVNAGAEIGTGHITNVEDTVSKEGDVVQPDGGSQMEEQNEQSASVMYPEMYSENATNLDINIDRDETASAVVGNASILVPEEPLSSSIEDGSEIHTPPSEIVSTDANHADVTEIGGEHGRSSLFKRMYPTNEAQDEANIENTDANFENKSSSNATNNGIGNDTSANNNRRLSHPWREYYGYEGTSFPRRGHHHRRHPHPHHYHPYNHGARSSWLWSSRSSNLLDTHSHSEKRKPTVVEIDDDSDFTRRRRHGSGRRFDADSNCGSSAGTKDWKALTDKLLERTSTRLRDLGLDMTDNALKFSLLHNPWRHYSTSTRPPYTAPPPPRLFEDVCGPCVPDRRRYLRALRNNNARNIAGADVVIDLAEDARKIRRHGAHLKSACLLNGYGGIETIDVTKDRGYAQSPLPDANRSPAVVNNETSQAQIFDPPATNGGIVIDVDDDPDNEGFYWSSAVWSDSDRAAEVNSHTTNNVEVDRDNEQSGNVSHEAENLNHNTDAPFNSPLYPVMNENADDSASHVPNIVMPEALTFTNNEDGNADLENGAQSLTNNVLSLQDNTVPPSAEPTPLDNSSSDTGLLPPGPISASPQSAEEIATLTSRIAFLQTHLAQIEQKLDDIRSLQQMPNIKRKRDDNTADEQDSPSSTPGPSAKRSRITARPEPWRADFERLSEVMISRQRARMDLAREIARRRRLHDSRSGPGIGMLATAAVVGSVATWAALAFL